MNYLTGGTYEILLMISDQKCMCFGVCVCVLVSSCDQTDIHELANEELCNSISVN